MAHLSRTKLTSHPLKQRFVLAEAIKTSSIPVEKLVNFVEDGNVQPAWPHMLLPLGKPYLPSSQLPKHKLQKLEKPEGSSNTVHRRSYLRLPYVNSSTGRNLKSCMDAWNALRPHAPQSYAASHISPYGPTAPPGPPISSAPHKRKPPSEPGETFAAAHAPKRRQSAGDTTTSMQRVIQPKPSSNGQSPPLFPSPLPGLPKKRGRPSKAEVEARNADLVARGHVLPPPKASTPRSKPPELAPREPEPLQQRDPPFFPVRPSLPPIMGARPAEGQGPEIAYESSPAQPNPLDIDASDQSGRKKRRAAPKQSPKDTGPGEANPSAVVGGQPQFSALESRPPTSAQVQVLAPRPSDRPSPVVVEASPVQVSAAAESSTTETTGTPAGSGK